MSSMVRKAIKSRQDSTSYTDYLHAIINSLEDELMVIDRYYRVIEINDAGLMSHQKNRQEVIGQHCYEVSHGSRDHCRAPLHECPAKAVWTTGKPSRATHIHTDYAYGTRRKKYIDINASPITDELGNVTAVAVLMRDVTEGKEMELNLAALHEEVRHKDEIRSELLREIFSIQEEERRRIARELHDETSQGLASLAASLVAVASILPANTDIAKNELKKAQNLSIHILDETHKLIYDLRPSLLDDLGLVATLRWLADNKLTTAGVKVNFKSMGQERRLSPKVETTLFRVIQEAVSNIAKHAHAKNASLMLRFKENVIKIRIRDDGKGFNTKEAMHSKKQPRGLGLLGMKERMELMDGSLTIRSSPSAHGTEIIIEIPLDMVGSQ